MKKEISTLDDKLHWYKDAVIYEVHIKAFHDSNGDGIGDFNGLMLKLDYLQDLGVTAIWLLPFYPSPLRDDGYDIADYYSINPSYGDIKQFKKLLTEAHKRNLKVITELVLNHTSDQHPWFQRARKSPIGSKNRDYYVWTDNPHQFKDARIIFQDYEASNWTWDAVAGQYFWHRFFHHQPDLNYDNPAVQDEVFKIISYWCKMGVDGFRLDAVPYLFEREGTNCENLPETHAFLKKLRSYVDANFPGTLLLAEANMWPEDSASYFGDGDECQMNYHFPVMPRMFMSVQMEDRFPITDIFDQTPKIPENCQWAIFLRNHDELTLEMVTDEERDYMYKAYVKDPRSRINLGIRHRLAPLMANNRKKIELLNCLLFSFPGTPVMYYGDEIGMGDNVYLGDRDGVRTPMQWSADRNAGFSNANPQQLYLPIILDPQYHYEAVNVEMQSQNTSSLLWWTKRIIAIRKRYKSLSRGDIHFLQTENPKILAFIRTWQNESMLIVANLSRNIQPVELDLAGYEGYGLTEALSKNKFPIIKPEQPYFLSVSAYDCQWFILKKEDVESTEVKDLPFIELPEWNELQEPYKLEELENNILPNYLAKVRWFGGKSRSIQNIRITDHARISFKSADALLLLIEIQYDSGMSEIYQLPLAFETGLAAKNQKESLPGSILAEIRVKEMDGILYDAYTSSDFAESIIQRMASGRDVTLHESRIDFYGSKELKSYVKANKSIVAKVLAAEQSNTSITFDKRFYMKLYRKVDRAINPDVEIIRFLSENTSFKNIPAFSGAVEWKFSKNSIVLGMMQEMIQNEGNAWDYMLKRVEDFNDAMLAGSSTLQLTDQKALDLNYKSDNQDINAMLGIPMIEQIKLLGIRTGEMHLALSNTDDEDFKPEAFSLHYQRSLYSSFQTQVRATFQNQSRNMQKLSVENRKEAEQLLSEKSQIMDVFKKIYAHKIDSVKIRIHGDYHLGQVLSTGKDFIILDFEGEPARSYSERRLKRSPLRDVAGMIRSFHYVAHSYVFMTDHVNDNDIPKLLAFADQWYCHVTNIFLKSYLDIVDGSNLIPEKKEDLQVLLQIYLLEKAIYELNYELNNRPDWVKIPLKGIRSVLNDTCTII